jgi:chromo domain-containing protein 1
MPGFGQMLRQDVRVWSLGYQPAIWWEEPIHRLPPVMQYDCIEILPALGGFIFITDEVFETKPQVALELVKLFFDKVEKVKQLDGPSSPYHEVVAPLFWRLYVRPELMDYLYEHCMAYEGAHAAGDPDVKWYVHCTPDRVEL